MKEGITPTKAIIDHATIAKALHFFISLFGSPFLNQYSVSSYNKTCTIITMVTVNIKGPIGLISDNG
jgi:hypothetical protein